MASQKTILLELALFSMVFMNGVYKGRSTVRKDLNKEAPNFFKTEAGQVFDCIDIYRQPALDHPLLQNHTIQMKPTSFPKGFKTNASATSTSTPSEIWRNNVECPEGTVPILRVENQVSERGKYIQREEKAHRALVSITQKTGGNIGKFHGSRTYMATYNPPVRPDEYSSAAMWIQNGLPDQLNSIQVGWTVNPALYRDMKTHLFAYWTADGFRKTGCFDARCPGFVQVSPSAGLGLVLEPTSHDGKVYISEYHVFQDSKTGDWWLAIFPHDLLVGYWPKAIFTSLATHAELIAWGGETYSPDDKPAPPPMGSGSFAPKAHAKTCYAGYLEVIDESYKYREPKDIPVESYASDCYRVEYDGYEISVGYAVLFGGPGGNC